MSNQGVQGTQGNQGNQGNQGLQGLSNQGVQGRQGNQGNQGLQGLSNQGVQGRQGSQGNQGLQGTQATQGRQGLQGLSNQGLQGTIGIKGDPGTSGFFVETNAGIHTLSSVGIGTTNPDSVSLSSNTAVLNVGIVTANEYYGDGSNLSGVSGLVSRATLSGSTGNLTSGSDTNITITGYKTYSLLKVDIDNPAWVTIYTDTASRTADASRAFDTDPLPGSGVIAEVYTTTAGSSTFLMSPGVIGWNNDGTPSQNIYLKVENTGTGLANITVDLTAVKLEA